MVIVCHGDCAKCIKHGRPKGDPRAGTRKIGESYGPRGYCPVCCGWVPAEGQYCFCCGGRVRRKPRACLVARNLRRKAERAAARAERQCEADGCSALAPTPPGPVMEAAA